MQTISTDELEELRDSETRFYLVNVLPEEDYEDEHIPGSVNIPADRIQEEAEDKFGSKDRIVVYGSSEETETSEDAARELQQAGFKYVKNYQPGLKGWKEAGNSTI